MEADHARRQEAFAAYNEWERTHPKPREGIEDLIRWLIAALRFARRSGDFREPDPTEKAEMVARRRAALAHLDARRR